MCLTVFSQSSPRSGTNQRRVGNPNYKGKKLTVKSKRLLPIYRDDRGITAANSSAIFLPTTGANTGFKGTGALISQTTVASPNAPTLTLVLNEKGTCCVPSKINLGDFKPCLRGVYSTFSAFTFNFRTSDTTISDRVVFVGSLAGGTIFSDVSNLEFNWAPLQLGPGRNNLALGDIVGKIFTIPPTTTIVAPNASTAIGNTSVEGFGKASAVP